MKWRFTAFMILVVGVLVFALVAPIGAWSQSLSRSLADLGIWGPVLCFAVIFLVCVCMLPLFPCIVACGALLGVPLGLATVLPAALAGSVVSAFLGRTVLRKRVLESVREKPRWQAVITRFQERGFLLVILARCVPALPFGMQNCALGAIGIGSSAVFFGTLVGMLPAIGCGLYIGYTIGDVTRLQSGLDAGQFDGLRTALLLVGLVAIVTLLMWINRAAKSTIQVSESAPDSMD